MEGTRRLALVLAASLVASCTHADADLTAPDKNVRRTPAPGIAPATAVAASPGCTGDCDTRGFEMGAPRTASSYLTGIKMPLPPPAVPPPASGDVFSLGPQPTASSYITGVKMLPPPAVLPTGSGEGFTMGMPRTATSYITPSALPLPPPSALTAYQTDGFAMDSPATAASYVKDMPPAAPPPEAGAPLGSLSCIPGWAGNEARACPTPVRTRPAAPTSRAPALRPAASAAPAPAAVVARPKVAPAPSLRPQAAPSLQPQASAPTPARGGKTPLIVREASGGQSGEMERMFRAVAWDAMKGHGFQMVRENGTTAHVLRVRFHKDAAAAEAGPATVDWQLLNPQGRLIDTYRQQLMLFPGLYDPKLVPAISDLVEDALRRVSGSVGSQG